MKNTETEDNVYLQIEGGYSKMKYSYLVRSRKMIFFRKHIRVVNYIRFLEQR